MSQWLHAVTILISYFQIEDIVEHIKKNYHLNLLISMIERIAAVVIIVEVTLSLQKQQLSFNLF